VANILAQIAAIEIPRQEWDELVPNLCQNSTSEDLNIRLASLKTLGYICEELHTEATPEPSRLAIKALLHSVPFTAPNFKV
jgi:importin subunit beta-1